MAIERTVETNVYCDICGEWIMGWRSNDTGVSKVWASYYARKKGCTVGKKITCKNCRIKKAFQTCSVQHKIGNAGRDNNGMCRGFGMLECKRCFACTSYEPAMKEENDGEHM